MNLFLLINTNTNTKQFNNTDLFLIDDRENLSLCIPQTSYTVEIVMFKIKKDLFFNFCYMYFLFRLEICEVLYFVLRWKVKCIPYHSSEIFKCIDFFNYYLN